MADPRFYDNRGPFAVSELCVKAGVAGPVGNADALIHDVAGLAQAGPAHLTFFDGRDVASFAATRAGWCFVAQSRMPEELPEATVVLPCLSVQHAFAIAARLFYPEHEIDICEQDIAIHPTAKIGEAAIIAPGVCIGPNAQIGAHAKIGPFTSIGRGVTIGNFCQIGAHASIGFAYLGDYVIVQAGARIGGSGFGFASSARGHAKDPQLGRVIVQDHVEIGANSTIDRGTLGDTVIGEGTKIDNLVQIGHNTMIGRHCILAGQVGVSGSATLGDFVMLGGNAGVSDHVSIGDGARLAGFSAAARDLPGGEDYAGIPARPMKQAAREVLALARLVKTQKRNNDE